MFHKSRALYAVGDTIVAGNWGRLVDRTNELYSGHAILRDGSA
jgi:hypothetical protein